MAAPMLVARSNVMTLSALAGLAAIFAMARSIAQGSAHPVRGEDGNTAILLILGAAFGGLVYCAGSLATPEYYLADLRHRRDAIEARLVLFRCPETVDRRLVPTSSGEPGERSGDAEAEAIVAHVEARICAATDALPLATVFAEGCVYIAQLAAIETEARALLQHHDPWPEQRPAWLAIADEAGAQLAILDRFVRALRRHPRFAAQHSAKAALEAAAAHVYRQVDSHAADAVVGGLAAAALCALVFGRRN